jgi:hypothetical protein
LKDIQGTFKGIFAFGAAGDFIIPGTAKAFLLLGSERGIQGFKREFKGPRGKSKL